MPRIQVEAGVCGFVTTIHVSSSDGQTVQYEVDSQCPHVQAAMKSFPEINAFEDLFRKPHETVIYTELVKHLPHAACPIYCAFFKAAELATHMALPGDVSIQMGSEE